MGGPAGRHAVAGAGLIGDRRGASRRGRMPRTLPGMDIGDLVFLGVLLASGIGSAIAAGKKKAKVSGLKTNVATPKTGVAPNTGLTAEQPKQPTPLPAQAHPARQLRRPLSSLHDEPAAAPPTPRRRNRWREYIIMREVLGPPKAAESPRSR